MFLTSFFCIILPLTNAADVVSAVCEFKEQTPFVLRGTVACVVEPANRAFVLVDDSGSAALIDNRSKERRTFALRPGDILCVTGNVSCTRGAVAAPCNRIVRTGTQPPPKPWTASIADLKTGRYDGCFVRVTGTVRESFRDEIDPEFTFLVLGDGTHATYGTIDTGSIPTTDLHALTGSRISVLAICQPARAGQRRHLGRTLAICGTHAITVLQHVREDPFGVPPIDSSHRHSPDQILAMDRRRIAGRVLAVRQGNRAILQDDDGNIHNIGLVEADPPAYGADIEAEGFAATDLYRINLTGATWRQRGESPPETNAEPIPVTAKTLFQNSLGHNKLNTRLHGATIRLRGTVLDIPIIGTTRSSLLLKCDGYAIPVDATSCQQALNDVTVGCQVEVTGCCAVEVDNWHSYSAFPHATGITLVMRTPDDLTILARPPWWTPTRFRIVIGSLLAFLVLLLGWSISLWRIAGRRGRQLLRTQIGQIGSELRVEERTRLAIELHDSISQNLSGVSMQIDAARRWLGGDRNRTDRHLDIASRTLVSCREELRNCIWDLRNQTFEEENMAEAIRRTLAQRLDNATLVVRFAVPRNRISDNTAHALLCIIRELATNAVRHGRASAIKIAGALDDGQLRVSVTDNGSGFDPDHRPGIAEGHFGLQGIAERIRRLNGTLQIESSIGRGCRVCLSFGTVRTPDRKNNA